MKQSLIFFISILCFVSIYRTQLFYSHLTQQNLGGQFQFEQLHLNIQTQCNKNIQVPNYQVPHPYIMMTGYLSVNEEDSHSALAFTFVGAIAAGQNYENLKDYPVMIWLNGGPGSSSQLGNFIEMGPIIFNQTTGQIKWNQFTWARNMSIIYLDQPVGTGFSYIQREEDLPTDMPRVAAHVWTALQNLYLNPAGCFYGLNLQKAPLFVAGESYAGQYAPAITEQIHKMQLESNNKLKLNLKGMLLVDGITDPYSTISQMGMYAYNTGLIDYQQRAVLQACIMQSVRSLKQGNMLQSRNQFNQALQHIKKFSGGVNVYNIRRFNVQENYLIEDYLNNIKENLGFHPKKKFLKSNHYIYNRFANDMMSRDCIERVEYLLSKNVPILICNGQLDLIVNTPGTMMWVDQLQFSHDKQFQQKQFTTWVVDGQVAGYMQNAGPLNYFNVNKAGHMVPADQPQNGYAMMNGWMQTVLQE